MYGHVLVLRTKVMPRRMHYIAAKGGKIFECTYFYPSWYAKIRTKAVADLQNEVTEDDEGNNSRLMSIKVQKPLWFLGCRPYSAISWSMSRHRIIDTPEPRSKF